MVGLRKTSKLAAEIPLSLIPRKHAKSMHVTNMATEYVGDDFFQIYLMKSVVNS